MKKFHRLIWVVCLLMQACVSLNENSVNPSEEVPVSVAEVIRAKYPSAAAMKFSLLEEGKVYQAEFDMGGKNVPS